MDHREDRKRILRSLALAGVMLAAMWIVHALLGVFDVNRRMLGIFPGQVSGLWGILTSPWIHGDLAHIVGNSGPLFFFVAALAYYHPKSAWRAMAGIWLLTGLWVWMGAQWQSKPGVLPIPHIGASGVVYGLGGFLFFSGIFKRDRRSITLALVIALLFGASMIPNMFPTVHGVSWESHFFGVLAGFTMAWWFRKWDVQPKKRYHWEDEPDTDPNDAQAVWNYRQNWPGSNQLYMPGEAPSQDQPTE
jgi:membrane associated rhomboid family serine protease